LKILLDHNIPVQIRKQLPGHLVLTARALGWARLQNGELLKAAEVAGYQAMLTGDQSIVKQQNNLARQIALVVVTRIDIPGLEEHIEEIRAALDRAVPGGYELVELPPRRPAARP